MCLKSLRYLLYFISLLVKYVCLIDDVSKLRGDKDLNGMNKLNDKLPTPIQVVNLSFSKKLYKNTFKKTDSIICKKYKFTVKVKR